MATQNASERRQSGGSGSGETLRTSQAQAFYFYTQTGQPVISSSRSLGEFLEVVQRVDPSSVQFHIERGDFERWFRWLGEWSLANQVAGLRGRNFSPQELRTELTVAVGSCIYQQQQSQQQQQGQGQGNGGNQGATAATRSGSTSSGRSTR
jgi:hypothetical protein